MAEEMSIVNNKNTNQYKYIEGINAAEDAYNNIVDSIEGLRSVLDMLYTDISQTIIWLKEIANISNEAISILSNTEEI